MVVDTNQLRDQRLREYLTQSTYNFAVVPDYTMMETYKVKTLKSIYASLEILGEFPKQVIALKGSAQISGLSGRPAGLQRRMIDEKQTRNFPEFCADLNRAHAGDPVYQASILRLADEATKHLDDVILPHASTWLSRIDSVARATYSESEMKMLRQPNFSIDRSIATKILRSTFELGYFSLEHHHARQKLTKDVMWFKNTFPFRFALCVYMSVINWIACGGGTATKATKVRNDLVDAAIAAYATYFNGLLSADGKALHIYDHAMAILSTILARPSAYIENIWSDTLAHSRT
jgi:hypothetical protein